MRKAAAWLLTGLLILSMTACAAPAGGSMKEIEQTAAPAQTAQETANAPAQLEAMIAPAPETQYKIAVIAGESAEPSSIRMALGVQEFASATGMSVSMQGTTGNDPAQQEKLVLEQIKTQPDAICITPIDATALSNALKQAKNAGIKVVAHQAAGLDGVSYDIEPVGNELLGACIMDCLAEAMQESGTYAIMVSAGDAADENIWADNAVLHQQQVYPDMTLLSDPMRIQAGTSADSAYEKAKELLENNTQIKGILCTTQESMLGAARAIEEMGLCGKTFVSGQGKPSACKSILQSGAAASLVTWDPALVAKAMCALAVKLAAGETVQDHMDLGVAGYNDLCFRTGSDSVLEGQAWTVVNAANMESFDF